MHNTCSFDKGSTRKITVIVTGTRIRDTRHARRGCNSNNLIRIHTDYSAHNSTTKFSYLNIGSLKNKTFGVYDYIVTNNLDILALTETWLFNDEQQNLIYLTELLPQIYKVSHIPRSNGQKASGGVAIIYRDSLCLDVMNASTNSSNNTDNKVNQFEFMDCKLSSNSRTVFRLMVVYRPPPTRANNLKIRLF